MKLSSARALTLRAGDTVLSTLIHLYIYLSVHVCATEYGPYDWSCLFFMQPSLLTAAMVGNADLRRRVRTFEEKLQTVAA